MSRGVVFWLALGIIVLVACGETEKATPTGRPAVTAAPPPAAAQENTPIPRVLPTLYPTATALRPAEPTATPTARPVVPTNTPVDFGQTAVELHYTIPILGLDRTLVADVSGRLKVTDETTGGSVERGSQSGVLLEMQQAFSGLELESVPDDCDGCVQIAYELPLNDESGEGWLQDPVLLASVENFFAALLDPHFPSETVAGLRRSATPFQVAYTVAQTTDGQIWRWTATESEVGGPEDANPTLDLDASVAELELSELGDAYEAPCPQGSGIETLALSDGEERIAIQLVCPELALPAVLLPVYLALDDLAAEKMAGQGLPEEEPEVTVDSLLVYRRDDGAWLTLFWNGRAVVETTDELAAGETLSATQVLSLTNGLVESGALEPGVSFFVAKEVANTLMVRGLDAVYEAAWNDVVPPEIESVLAQLDDLINRLLSVDDAPAVTGTPAGEETNTPEPAGTSTPEPTPTSQG